jgi:ribose transport system ATP-binding protein
MSEPLLRVCSVTKNFPGVQALKGVDFELYPGEVHCLIGANGAGKSTLIKILSGVYRKDSGKIIHKGKEVEISSPKEARKLGIATVFQELDVVPYLSIAENVFLGDYPRRRGVIDYKEMLFKAQTLLKALGEEDIDPSLPIAGVSTAVKQLVVIARALALSAEVVIFDEPTAVLGIEEQQRLFRVIRELRRRGISVIYVSHRLEEIIELGDRVTVLRDGIRVSTRAISETNLEQLVEDMMGQPTKPKVKSELEVRIGSEEVVLSVMDLYSDFTRPKLKGISFSLRKGEVLGLFGFVGSGRSELARCLIGCFPPTSGRILIEGKPVSLVSPWKAMHLGLAMAPEERKSQGLFLDLSVSLNITLPTLRDVTRRGLIRWKEVNSVSEHFTKELEIKTPSLAQPVRYLSGGNQQKVILARWFAKRCKVLILDEPMRGVDVAGKREIAHLIREKAKEGVSFIVISSEAEELLEVSDRVAVMFRGQLMGIMDATRCDVAELLKLASGIKIGRFCSAV